MSDITIWKSAPRVLVLEDDLRDRQLLEAVLEVGGVHCQFIHTTTRKEFENALAEIFDLIISDFSLPDYDGLSALALTREMQADTPFLFVSGAIDAGRAEVAFQMGVSDCILKDRPDHIVMAVKRALRTSKQREELQKLQGNFPHNAHISVPLFHTAFDDY